MIESLKDLGITGEEKVEEIDAVFQEKLGISFSQMAAMLESSLQERADEVAADFLVMTPFGDYGKMLEDQPKIAHFLRREASKIENWKPTYIGSSRDPKLPDMIEILFGNMAVDEGEALSGYIFMNHAGKVLHVFVQGNP